MVAAAAVVAHVVVDVLLGIAGDFVLDLIQLGKRCRHRESRQCP